MYKLELQWKEFKVNLSKIDQTLTELYPSYAGNQAHSVLELWFKEDLTEDESKEIKQMWDSLTEESEEVKAYKSLNVIEEERKAKKQSAKDKLKKLGLTEEEIAALVGV